MARQTAKRQQTTRSGGTKRQAARRGGAGAERLESFYRTMYRIRRFEEETAELFQAGIVKGTAHSYIGQEAVATGACAALRQDDYVGSNHRGHGHCVAQGADPARMMAELMGRADGYCGGLGGSMHIADMELNILGANGIVGASMAMGAGAALAGRLQGLDRVSVSFFGDGATNEGIFHETLNLAAVWKLPVVFICENNQWALSTSIRHTTSLEKLSDRAKAYNIPGVTIDGNDVEAVYDAVRKAVARARKGEGPTLIEAVTWRWGQHSMRANLKDPRSLEDREAWMGRDPIKRLEERIGGDPKGGRSRLKTVQQEVEQQIQQAVAFGKASPEPDPAVLERAVYAPHAEPPAPPPAGERELTFAQAVAEAMHQEMERDERVFLMGEDVGTVGGIFQTAAGLLDAFGPERVRETPISEAGYCGLGVGAAVAGMRPIVEVQIFDFVTHMMDQIVNQAAKFRFMLGGKNTVPLVIRGPQGGGIRLAAQHSQSLEAWFTHVPGLVVVAPSTPYDAKGLLAAAIRDDNPVLFLEHKILYLAASGPVPTEPYALPLGKASVKREGTDVTVLATQLMVSRALAAANELEREHGISVEVIDPRTLRPFDEETLFASLAKTHRLVIVHEAWKTGGWGAEIAALVVEKAFDELDAPVLRVGAVDVPMPFSDPLERHVIPSQERIVDAVRSLF